MIAKGDGAKAERFFGSRLVEVKGAWMPSDAWEGAWAGAVATGAA